MSRPLFLSLMLALFTPALLSAEEIKVEPAFWWSGMKNPELQLMIYGKGISDYKASVNAPGVYLRQTVELESPNYLLIYLDVAEAEPGEFTIHFTRNKKSFDYTYELKARQAGAAARKGFDASDVLYLIMPDRFANGNPANDNRPMNAPYRVDRKQPGARHGGDLAGIEQHLDYIDELGVTAIWLNPVLENDMEGGSYHGYAITDYYKVDARLGTNEDYLRLINQTHARGMRVVMDMIFNHCGSNHPWIKDVPATDWFNHLDRYVQTNHDKEAHFDPYVSDYDREVMMNGWFVESMPDLNQRNPHVARYLIQNSIWWIEYSGVDGIRQDTYPYADMEMMADWCHEVMNEYPDYNIVGEAWMNQTIGSAYWQTGSRMNFGKDTGLKSVMDFRLMTIASQAFQEETLWSGGLHSLFEHLCYDYVYPDIYNVLRFLENHDTNRFLPSLPTDLNAFRQAITFLLTIPGIPQIYYGQELLMYGSKEEGDGYVRLDVPGGWPDDPVNQFLSSGRTLLQNEARTFMQTLLRWRRGNDIIARGRMKHFMVNQGVYVYERRLEERSVLIFLNGSSREVSLPLARYAEVLRGESSGRDVLTGENIPLANELLLPPKGIYVLELY